MQSGHSAVSSMYVVSLVGYGWALTLTIKPSMAQGVERLFKADILDGNSSISSAALVPAYQTITSTSYITQYHALGLLYLIRQQDRMAITKMIQQLGGGKSGTGTTLKNHMALCMLI